MVNGNVRGVDRINARTLVWNRADDGEEAQQMHIFVGGGTRRAQDGRSAAPTQTFLLPLTV